MDFNSKQFKDLRSKWYKKLREKGFEDVELNNGDLKLYHADYFALKNDPTTIEAKEDYYRYAGQFLHDYKFASKLEQSIWQHHSDGKGIRQILILVRKQGFKTYRDEVHNLLKELIKVFKDHVRAK